MAESISPNITEPDVVKEVMAGIAKLGENTKANYDEMNRRYDELKSVLNTSEQKMNALVEEQLKKLATDITVRQEALDKENTKIITKQEELFKAITDRMDSVEVAFKRGPQGYNEADIKNILEAQEFTKSVLSVNGDGNGVSVQDLEKKSINKEDFLTYQKTFNDFLRTKNEVRQISPERFKALSVGIDPDGGYTVTPAMNSTIITRMYEMDPIRQLANTETITTGAMEWLVDWDQAGWGWEEETAAGAETDTPQFYKKRIPVHVLYAKPRASQTLLEDSGINISDWIARKVADRFNRGEAAAFVTGNGVGQPRGFTTYSNGTTYGTVEQVAMGHATALTADGFYDVKYSLIEQYLERGTWLMARGTLAAALLLKDGTGNYLWNPNYRDDMHSTLLGLPVRMSTSMPAVAASALSVALADWREAYTIVDRLGITIQRDPFTVKPMVEFYTRKRVGGDLSNFQAIKLGIVSV